MPIKTSESITGLIVGDPRIHHEEDEAQPRFCVRIQIKDYERDENGASVERDRFYDLIQYGPSAVLSAQRFRSGNRFLAQGRVHTRTETIHGRQHTIEQFLASRIAHDPSTTVYRVDRRPRLCEHVDPEPERPSATRSRRTTTASRPAASGQPEGLGH